MSLNIKIRGGRQLSPFLINIPYKAMLKPSVSFVILNFNTAQLVLKCVESIRRNVVDTTFEIIVVDNGSDPADRDAVLAHQDEFQVVVSRQNLGFGGGNMLGANVANGDYLCFLNSDVELTSDCVTPLVAYLRDHSDVGCITPQQYNSQGQLVSSFNHDLGLLPEIVNRKILERLFPARFPSRRRLHDAPFTAHHINGCFLLMPAPLFWQCGGFDMNIFLYSEEYDLSMRLLKLGYHCTVNPNYSFVHHQGKSTENARSLTRREGFISDVYAFRKYHNAFHSFLYRLVIIIKLLPKVKRWYILPVLLSGSPLSLSMRHKKYI